MASGHVNRVKRPNTWLHRPMLQNVKKVLANPEPSTHDPNATSARSQPIGLGSTSSCGDMIREPCSVFSNSRQEGRPQTS